MSREQDSGLFSTHSRPSTSVLYGSLSNRPVPRPADIRELGGHSRKSSPALIRCRLDCAATQSFSQYSARNRTRKPHIGRLLRRRDARGQGRRPRGPRLRRSPIVYIKGRLSGLDVSEVSRSRPKERAEGGLTNMAHKATFCPQRKHKS